MQEYPCPMCVRDFNSDWLLQKHLVIVHDQKKQNLKTIECDYCDAILKKGGYLLYHIKSKHPEAYPEEYKIRMANKESYDLCEIQYPRNPLSLAFHKSTFHPQKDPNNSKNILCRICGESVRGKMPLRVHIKMAHFNLKPPRCNVCSSYFPMMCQLRAHLKSTTCSRDSIPCEHCQETFLSKIKLRSHLKHVHGFTFHANSYRKKLKEDPISPCHICGKIFPNPQRLKNHLNYVHVDERPWICEQCGRKLKTKPELDSHKETHLPKTIKCTVEGIV